MHLYAITDRKLPEREDMFSLAQGWVAGGVDFIQLREKDLNPLQLQKLTRELAAKTHLTRSRLLVNIATPESASLAFDAGAAGVHIPGPPQAGAVHEVRRIFPNAIVSLPCHSLEEVAIALQERADLILFSPVFEKPGAPSQGLEALYRACVAAQGIPVFALGGVTGANAPHCLAAGAAGVAGIRLFASGDWRALRQPSQGNDI